MSKTPARPWIALCIAVLAGCAADRDPAGAGAAASVRRAPQAWRAVVRDGKALAGNAAGVIASRLERRDAPSFIWAAPSSDGADRAHRDVRDLATADLARYAPAYALAPAAVATATISHVHDTGRGGIAVTFQQRPDGIEVFGERLSLLMRRDGQLLALSGALHPAATAGVAAKLGGFPLDARAATAAALTHLHGTAVSADLLVDVGGGEGGYRRLALSPIPMRADDDLELAQPARAKRVLFPRGDALLPAYYIELDATTAGSTDAFAHAYLVDARTGAVLLTYPLTFSDTFQYRVWADSTPPYIPADGPTADATPHPTGVPDGFEPPYADPVLIGMEGFNTRADGPPDAWLPADATETLGNNVDAYADHNQPDGFSDGDLRASLTSDHTFDRVYDVTLAPNASPDQIQAAVTQVFYTTNWLHDWYYDSGFTESAGNAQADNYGRGGVAGDALLAEAQDTNGAERDNANMSVFEDGVPPRMQMYVWTGHVTTVGHTKFTITAPETIAGEYETEGADYGPSVETLASGTLVDVDDGSGTTAARGCLPLVGDLTGMIAVASRGGCQSSQKALNAQAAGAIALIVTGGGGGGGGGGGPDALPNLSGYSDLVTIPVLGVSSTTAGLIHGEAAGTVTADAQRAGHVETIRHDGSIDNATVAHEWGHYLHGRLGRCMSSLQCFGHGEGWGDFTALQMMMREGDDFDGAYPMSGYATYNLVGDSFYYGIRRQPYSTNKAIDGLTFRNISDGEPLPDTPILDYGPNSEVHNAGEVWATMMHEVQVALLHESTGDAPRLTYAEAHRRMSDYVVLGLELSPVDPTYTEMRDSMLAAAEANDPQDFLVMAQAFARRGVGTGAVSPPRDSEDLTGVVESFKVGAELTLVGVEAGEQSGECDDGDGVLDAGETGHLEITVMNGGVAALDDTTVTVSSDTPGVTFPNGPTVTMASVAPFETGVATVDVAIDAGVTGIGVLDLQLDLADPAAVEPHVLATVTRRFNFDVAPASSATDDVEADDSVWTVASDPAATDVAPWLRVEGDDNDHEWNGVDVDALSDHSIESPELDVGTEPFVVSFDHRYEFEASSFRPTDPLTYWDGGVIEVTVDGGVTWQDVSTFVDPGYGGAIYAQGSNALGSRNGFVAQSAGWPENVHATLDFGTQLAGQTVQLRFRVGTDEAVGDLGWFIDDIAFAGITNTPFPSLQPDPVCELAGGPDGGPGPGVNADDGGCGCSVGAAPSRAPTAGALLLGLLTAALAAHVSRSRRRPRGQAGSPTAAAARRSS